MFTRASYLVTAVAISGYLMFLLNWQARFARKWVLPLSAMLLVVLIPIAWAATFRGRKKEKKEPIWPQVALVPVWLYSLYVSLLIIGWISIGGI